MMMTSKSTILVFGGSGQTGQHFIAFALKSGHKVRAFVRAPNKIASPSSDLEVIQGSIVDYDNLDDLLRGVDFVVCMLGDAKLQKKSKVNAIFLARLVPAMRRQGVKRFLYQAGGLTRPYKQTLPLMTWVVKNTMARFAGLIGQHEDNEAVIEYLVEEAKDIDWIVHRASIVSNGPSKGDLKRSKTRAGLATFVDTALYNYRLLFDQSAIHSCDLSFYVK